MATEIGDNTWDTFLNQHKSLVSLLDDHASLLIEMRKICQEESVTRQLVQTRLNTTETLIAGFKQSAESLQEITKREEEVVQEDAKAPESKVKGVPIRPTKIPKSQKTPNPVPDPSGFFTIDPNPTPVEQLYKAKPAKEKPTTADKVKKSPKRKAEGRPSRAEPAIGNEPKRKRTKANHEPAAPCPPAVEEVDGRPHGNDEDEDEDSFAKAVAARSIAKEEKRRAKADKKRKRESGESVEAGKLPEGKKRKEKHDAKVHASNAAAPSTGTAPVNAKQKQNGKRPRTQEEDDEHDRNSGASGSKRKKSKRKQVNAEK